MEKNGGRRKKFVVDLSPFFLLEAAGDSEGDLDYHHNMVMVMGMGSSCHDNEEDDDALSCSYDVWDDNNISSHINEARNDVCTFSSGTHKVTNVVHRHGNHHHGHVVDDDDYGDGELMIKGSKEGIMYSKIGYSSREDCKKCTSEVMSTANSNSSRKSCIDSIEGKKLSEKERSRLFWESCLAS